ncbi:hypothetical protein WDW89_08385 [Deltaproteobacteria bacterium TL4]
MKVTIKGKNRILLLCWLLISINLWVQTAFAAPTKQEVQALLLGYEWQLNPELFKNLGPDTDLVLMEIINDPQPTLNYIINRALITLRLYQNERVAQFLEAYIEKGVPSSTVRRAIDSFARAFKDAEPQRVQKSAERLLTHSDPHTQIAAARILKSLNTSASTQTYQRYMRTSMEDWQRTAIQKEDSDEWTLERGILRKKQK